jgi:hypothetical protein
LPFLKLHKFAIISILFQGKIQHGIGLEKSGYATGATGTTRGLPITENMCVEAFGAAKAIYSCKYTCVSF